MLIGARNSLSSLVAGFVWWTITCHILPGVCGWPEGTYGTPASKDGCPSNDGFYRWKLGSILQITEYGSHTSGGVNLYGMTDGLSDRVYQTFCMKTLSTSDKKHYFMSGKYCIFKLHQCPARFQEGWIYWDDAGPWFGPTVQNSSGILPDGEYKRNTRIEYCCRLDGDTNVKIILPTSDPFYLLKYGDLCQEVVGMDVVEEWVYWAGEKSYNLDEVRGVHPKIERKKFPNVYTKLFYCYYTPKPRAAAELTLGSGFETVLTVLCIIGSTLGIVFLVAIILATIQKALIFRRQHRQQQSRRSQTDIGSKRTTEHQANARIDMKSPKKLSGLPEYSSCVAPTMIASKAQSICLENIKDSGKKVTPAVDTASILDDQACVDSIDMHPDADSEAPPSYDEVLRDGNLNFIV